ncbi:hypothetical protein ACFSKU_07550 [Pontibacter silvestris]|uniref:Outer membrane protein beta-barrel domain-containing protein n=1 Tax=Pontibacter silvestris TaxID=2305183 RepID=A0ABW4WYE6_9BACT|nr:hypothetical protein [Pontibacter silvestris]MCC9136645.1 hypothetical protein [Pontibacter silvestris]
MFVYNNDITRTEGWGVPVTFDYVLLYPFRRVQFYGTVMLTPMFSKTEQEKSQLRDGVTTISYSAKTSGINTYLTAGFGLGYSISKRFDAYANYHLISRNFNRDLRPRDEYPYPGSLFVGLNYRLKAKPE